MVRAKGAGPRLRALGAPAIAHAAPPPAMQGSHVAAPRGPTQRRKGAAVLAADPQKRLATHQHTTAVGAPAQHGLGGKHSHRRRCGWRWLRPRQQQTVWRAGAAAVDGLLKMHVHSFSFLHSVAVRAFSCVVNCCSRSVACDTDAAAAAQRLLPSRTALQPWCLALPLLSLIIDPNFVFLKYLDVKTIE